MKIILTTDVPKVGNRYDVKEFKDGYAQNVLIARGLAIMATPSELAKLDLKKKQAEQKRGEEEEAFAKLISSVNGKTITIKAKANDKGHLFKAVGTKDVMDAIKSITGIDLKGDSIIMENIKNIGTHMVTIKRGNKKGECKIVVESSK